MTRRRKTPDDGDPFADDPFADLRRMRTEDLEAESGRLDEQVAGWDDTDGDMRDYNDLVARASEAHRLVESTALARRNFERGVGIEIAFGGSLVDRSDPTFSTQPSDVLRLRPDEARDKALRAVETRGQRLGTDQADQMDRLLRSSLSEDSPNVDGSYIAKRTLITENDVYRSAWRRVVTQPHPVLTAEEVGALRALERLDVEYRAMSEGVNTAGGFGVPVFIDPSIVLTAQGSANPVRRIARTEVITTNAWKGVSSAGVTWSWDAEASAVSDDSPTLAQPTVPVYMARGFLPYSIELGQDYPGFADEMAQLLAAGYDELLAASFVTGPGATQPRGIVTALDANAAAEVLVATAGTLIATDIDRAWEALPDRFKPNATWLTGYGNSDIIGAFGNSNNLSYVTTDLSGIVQTLRTRPVEYTGYITKLSGASHQNVAVIGDFSNYLIAMRAGMSVELIQNLVDTVNNRPTGQRGLFAWARAGADSINDLGFRLVNQT